MSTRASARVVAVDGQSTVNYGAAIGSLFGLGAGAVVGLGVLVVKGIVWCGDKMEENYRNACQEWTDLRERARAENRADVQEIRSCLSFQLARMAISSVDEVGNSEQAETPTARQKELADAMAQARKAIDDASSVTRLKTENERAVFTHRLKTEIDHGRGFLPQADIAAAETALRGSPDAMRQAIRHLQTAWDTVSEGQTRQKRQVQRADLLLKEAQAQLNGLDALLKDTGNALHGASYARQRQDVADKLREARLLLATEPARALKLTEIAQQGISALTDALSTEMLAAWEQKRKKINALQGVLITLTKMVSESVALKLTTEQEVKDLVRRITAAQREAGALLEETAPVEQRVNRLSARIDLLKEEVFTIVQRKQQREVAQKVATTLGELGFQAGGEPLVADNGDMLHVEAMHAENTPGTERDDRIVSFNIARNGAISYDFQGYAGDSCVAEANRIFAALRAKGIFIVAPEAAEQLQKVPATSITPRFLQQERLRPQIVPNKSQSLLVERLKGVLERMAYPTIKQRAVGGTIELEAFKGAIGYHVVLSPEGAVQVYKGASHVDVSNDARDPVVAETHQEIEQVAPRIVPEEQQSTSTYIQPRRQHMIGN